jgi:hypothetical protein
MVYFIPSGPPEGYEGSGGGGGEGEKGGGREGGYYVFSTLLIF